MRLRLLAALLAFLVFAPRPAEAVDFGWNWSWNNYCHWYDLNDPVPYTCIDATLKGMGTKYTLSVSGTGIFELALDGIPGLSLVDQNLVIGNPGLLTPTPWTGLEGTVSNPLQPDFPEESALIFEGVIGGTGDSGGWYLPPGVFVFEAAVAASELNPLLINLGFKGVVDHLFMMNEIAERYHISDYGYYGCSSPGDPMCTIDSFEVVRVVVPEPASLLLLATGVLGVGVAQRRRKLERMAARLES